MAISKVGQKKAAATHNAAIPLLEAMADAWEAQPTAENTSERLAELLKKMQTLTPKIDGVVLLNAISAKRGIDADSGQYERIVIEGSDKSAYSNFDPYVNPILVNSVLYHNWY